MSKNRAFLYILICFVLLQLWFIHIMLSYPFSGFDINEKNGKWMISNIDHRSRASELGLHVGDIVLEIDGRDVDRHSSVIRWGTVDQAKKIVIVRNGNLFEVDTSQIAPIDAWDVSYLARELICLFVAIALYKYMNRSKSARYLASVFFTISLTFMSLGASIRGDALGKIVIGISIMLIPVTMLHFLIIFFKEKGSITINSRIVRVLYSFIFISLFLHLSFFMNWKHTQEIHRFFSNAELLFFTLGVCLNLGFLFYIFFKFRKASPYTSAMIKTIGISFVISTSPVICLSFVPFVLYGYEWIDSLNTSWIVLFFPLSFTYLLAAKKIYDIDLVVRRFILTTVLSIVPSVAIVGMISALFSARAKTEHLVMAFIFTVVLLSVTLYSLEYLTTRLERVVFPRRHYLQTSLKKIAKKLGTISSMRELKDLILADIVDILQVSGGALVFRYRDYTEVLSEGEISVAELEQALEGEGLDPSVYSCFEITRNEEYVSFLVLTPKKSNTLLGSEETQWLNLIISYLSVCMENLYLIRKMTMKVEQLAMQIPNETEAGELVWLRKLMFDLQEKERIRIATDLHDTTMQDLFFLKRKLSSLFERLPVHQENPQQWEGLLEYIDVINMNLRQSCFELHPYLLQEAGLVGTVEKLMDLEKTSAPFHIEFEAIGKEEIERIDMETKRHLFRVVQELLNNAKKHSKASRVKFILKAGKSNVRLYYEDDGVGFDTDRTVTREIGGSRIGMEQMKSRILSLDGHFELASAEGSGMKFSATLPMKEGRTA